MERIENKQKVKKALIMAGGLGTRFLPATLCLAKELFPIGNKPIIMYHIKDLLEAGIDDILIVGNKLKEESFKNFLSPAQDYLDKIESDGKMSYLSEYYDIMSKVKINYINQDDQEYVIDGKVYKNEGFGKKGSAIAILAGKGWANGEPFMAMNGDDLCFYDDGKSMSRELVDVYRQVGDCVVYGKELAREVVWKYSAMVLGETVANGTAAKVLDVVEKPAKGTEPSTIMSFSRYILNDEFFDRIFKVKPRSNGEWNMTEVIQNLAQSGLVSTCIFGGNYFDCGSMAEYSLANLYVAKRDEDSKELVSSGIKKLNSDEN